MERAAFNHLQPSRWSFREISRRTKGRIYESVVRTILFYGCKTWPTRVEDQHCLDVLTTIASAVSSIIVGVTASRAKL